MPPPQQLPVSPRFSTSTPEEYIDSLLAFWTTSPLLQTLCGGIHILDFFTRDSESTDGPKDIYHTVFPADWISWFAAQSLDTVLDLFLRTPIDEFTTDVPETLKTYIREVREHMLQRGFVRREKSEQTIRAIGRGTERALNAGMKPKKIHEVENFAAYLDDLVRDVETDTDAGEYAISHVIDYGSGQAYLSRTVAKKYGHNVVGIESRTVNIDGAKSLDTLYDRIVQRKLKKQAHECADGECVDDHKVGSLQYVQTFISDGNIDVVVDAIPDIPGDSGSSTPKSLLLTSLHSCGNLVHHALSAFRNTPSVRAVALIGCCYNLLTEKRGASFKPPYLRNPHPRLVATATAGDPQGFPVSATLTERDTKLNITARSMACQAPANWTAATCADFFERHFYRALLQRIFIDRGLIDPLSTENEPIVIGSLKKGSFDSFPAYIAAAVKKLGWEDRITVTEEEATEYMRKFEHRKKELSVVWSLMAYSAGICESIIVADRWLFLREMGCKQAWVEAAFDHAESPRNFVIVGIR
ncbi:methyltransferase domain-containing protein [Tricharina praecox]|uniref:methyltransferase domain-containing protein n=1 Tax=Tricharina praecox TaxID=43433 RepID=UPI00221E95A8|nr:methyltransferase domain-containing protein [Tricharina praecox]KAI5854436.1 methyltransferase domain-containing protein [Tricharina praecox]